MVLALYTLASRFDLLFDRIPFIGMIDDVVAIIWLARMYFGYRQVQSFDKPSQSAAAGDRKGRSTTGKSGAGSSSGPSGSSSRQGSHQSGQRTQGSSSASSKPAFDPYSVLNVSRAASSEEIDKAYREAARKYHPDKVNHLAKEFQDLAHERMVEIQRAYDLLKKRK